jgi:hypothetical protein
MIDWLNLFANSLWILGLAAGLAGLSYASWLASVNGEKLRTALGRPGIQATFALGGALFSAGLALTSDKLWEIAAWGVLGVLFLVQFVMEIRRGRKEPHSSS